MRTFLKRYPINNSDAIASYGYSRKYKYLDLEFTSGSLFRYFEIPRSMYDQLRKAKSKGQFFNRFIKGKKNAINLKKSDAKDYNYLVMDKNMRVHNVSNVSMYMSSYASELASKHPGEPYYLVTVLDKIVVPKGV